MVTRRRIIAVFAFLAVGAACVLGFVPGASLPAQETIGSAPRRIAIIGDIQKTNAAEEFLIAREQNDTPRVRIVRAVTAYHPDMLLLLGDQVSAGEEEQDWIDYDALMRPITDLKVPTFAVVGNHDYGFTQRAPRFLKHFYKRFGEQTKELPAVVRMGSIVLIAVNTNFDMLSPDEFRHQKERYVDALNRLDEDPTVTGVIIASHHPPYTNSSLGNDQAVIDLFAKPFLQARKTRLFLSGHVHSYERFVVQDKMFVVSGGGGGPRRQCNTSPTRACTNDAYREGALRPFHYMTLTIDENSLDAQVMMLRTLKGKKGADNYRFAVGDKFSLGLYGIPAATAADAKTDK